MYTGQFQSTHSQGVRHYWTGMLRVYLDISIHALTRSATIKGEGKDEGGNISIHALTRSATIGGVDTDVITGISIHALTRSATQLHICRRKHVG
ncbi:hypothetical protein POTG_01057 [Paenibacillus sp. oral taxon 786 str. D14]|nr:hypothetical protein POTG_01057 [Paenibacillus sp. oral taxon 786 str. D14]